MASWIVADKLHGTARHDLAKRSPPMVMVSFQMTVADALAIRYSAITQKCVLVYNANTSDLSDFSICKHNQPFTRFRVRVLQNIPYSGLIRTFRSVILTVKEPGNNGNKKDPLRFEEIRPLPTRKCTQKRT